MNTSDRLHVHNINEIIKHKNLIAPHEPVQPIENSFEYKFQLWFSFMNFVTMISINQHKTHKTWLDSADFLIAQLVFYFSF